MLMRNIVLLIVICLGCVVKAPAQSVAAFEAFTKSGTLAAQEAVVKLPIEIWNNLIVLKVKVNGQELRFMWDNGFSISGIDSFWVDKLNLQPFGDANNAIELVDGNNKVVNLTYQYAQHLAIGNLEISQSPFLLFDTRSITQSKEMKFDGVLGASVINKLNWKFNFDAGYVEVSTQPFDVTAADHVLPFVFTSTNLHLMRISFNHVETVCQVDFGANAPSIEVAKKDAVFFKSAQAAKVLGQNTISVGGLAPVDTMYTIKDKYSWNLAGVDLKFQPEVNFANSNSRVVLGNRIFRDRFQLVINCVGTPVYALTKRKHPELERIDSSFGYLFLKDGEVFKVVQVMPNANTEKHPLKLMDEVLLIDGKNTASFEDNYTLITYQKELLSKKGILKITLKNGNVISLRPVPFTYFKFKSDRELW